MNKKEKPLVSVVIPFYSNTAWLQEAIESVLNQTYKNIQIIVVNDGSKENVSDLIDKYKNDIIYVYQENKGPGSARNKGISCAEGKYIALLDSDDLWFPNKIESQVEYMESHKDIKWAHCAYETFGVSKRREIHENDMRGEMFPKCLVKCRIATPCVIIEKSVFNNKEIRFSETMRYGQDFYLWTLLSKKYYLGMQDEVLCKVRMRNGNAAKRAYVMLKAKSELWKNLRKIDWMETNKLPRIIKISYTLCNVNYSIIKRLQKVVKSNRIIEFVSKILYIIPYCILKMTHI